MVYCASTADAPCHINTQLFASIKVDFSFGVLVLSDASAEVAKCKTSECLALDQKIRRLDSFIDRHVHWSVI